MNNCNYPLCMMGGMGCERETKCDQEEKEISLHVEIEIAWHNTNPITTCGSMSKLEAMQKMFQLGYRAAMKAR